ncbi:YjfK family protein [Vibrio gallaecicus]|uniref:YjfK family protein n=1 Tax=Vibrio gallaecicus TaxID=552386 RepID=A0ABV4NAS3_9VIBR
MFGWFKKQKEEKPQRSQAPEVLGLRLGGAFELDDLKLKIIEPDLTIEGAARTQIIKAVGEVKLDSQSRLLRYYTDDEGFLQILQHGTDESGVEEVKLWYFYESKPIDTQARWQAVLDNEIVTAEKTLEEQVFTKVWENTRPVPMTETTWDQSGNMTTTDQFVMVYERQVSDDLFESLLVSGEETIVNNQHDRSVVTSTGINLTPTDFTLIS